LYYCNKWFDVEIPDDILKQSGAIIKASRTRRSIMLWMFDRGLLPDHPSCYDRWTGFARWILYLRSHYLKMPAHLLVPHLLYKSFWGPFKKRLQERKKSEPATLDKLLEEAAAQAKSR
ncbi:hypothetical protein, partial [Pseudomaricurvus sp.]|uniref:hypothetical protein n=1 Tax=Pseudomaricurvus sp. TaxID=2004510 RepID=UPI003F6B7424